MNFEFLTAKHISEFDIRQTVCVKDKGVVVVESIDGRDKCIIRANELLEEKEFLLLKLIKLKKILDLMLLL